MLNQKIRETIEMFRNELSPDLAALLEQGAGEISALDIIERAINVGDKAPTFTLNNQNQKPRSIADYLAKGPCVVTFYRGVWCPYCNLQLKEYADALPQIHEAGAQLVAISPEQPDAIDTLKAGDAPQAVVDMAVTGLPFDILYDQDSAVAKDFGLEFALPQAHRQLLKQTGVDIEAMTGSDTFVFPDPATYVIRTDGQVAWAYVPNNYRKRAEVDAILTAIKSI
jgi:peroxiredoxin